MSWHYGDPGTTEEEREHLQTLRISFPELSEEDDHFFLRFLRIRNFSVKEAEESIKRHLEVRRKMKVDTLLTDYTAPEVLKKCIPGGYFGEDRAGHPVWYDNFGNLDVIGLYRSVQMEQFMRHKLYQGEQLVQLCQQASLKMGRHIETFTMVVDFQNFSFIKQYHKDAIEQMIDVIVILEQNYPDRCGQILVINAPAKGVIKILWNFLKRFLDEKTRQKISIIKVEKLQEYISPDQLPMAYGGTRCEPDPYCTKYINPGCPVPKEYYLSNKLESKREESNHMVIEPGRSHLLIYEIEKLKTIIHWEFLSVDYDIGYQWYIKGEDDKENVKITSAQRIDSHVNPVSGNFRCDKPGKYVLKFDNTYSWFHSKQVLYSVKFELENELK